MPHADCYRYRSGGVAVTAQLIRVPGGKREHLGILSNHDWTPICGQRAEVPWFPLGVWNSGRSTGVCRDCITAAGAIADLAASVEQEAGQR